MLKCLLLTSAWPAGMPSTFPWPSSGMMPPPGQPGMGGSMGMASLNMQPQFAGGDSSMLQQLYGTGMPSPWGPMPTMPMDPSLAGGGPKSEGLDLMMGSQDPPSGPPSD